MARLEPCFTAFVCYAFIGKRGRFTNHPISAGTLGHNYDGDLSAYCDRRKWAGSGESAGWALGNDELGVFIIPLRDICVRAGRLETAATFQPYHSCD